jgi:hypothetical protein
MYEVYRAQVEARSAVELDPHEIKTEGNSMASCAYSLGFLMALPSVSEKEGVDLKR